MGMGDFKGSPTSLVADVDCTESGKDLCETHGVHGFPTIKYGDPGDLKAYEGGRGYEELKKIAEYQALDAKALEDKISKWKSVVADDIPIMTKVIGYKKPKASCKENVFGT